MDITEKRQPITLYEVPLLSEQQINNLIIKSLPQAKLSPEHITLRRKDGKYQAFIMVPSTKVEEICVLKNLIINKENVTIKKPFTQAQVFIKRIPDSVSVQEVRIVIQTEFGKIAKIHEGHPFQEVKSKFWHCYLQFVNTEDAQKCLFHPKKIVAKGIQLRPFRAFSMTEGDETDKKLFLKIVSQIEDQDDLQKVLNDQFRKEGRLREKIRVDNGIAVIVYTSAASADKVLHNFKGGKIGKYEVILRPYANKDSFTVFVGGLKASVTAEELEKAFKNYQPILSCNILTGKNPNHKNGTITLGSKQAYGQLLTEYTDDKTILDLFEKKPYITQHMSAKERNEYNQYVNQKKDKKPIQGPMIPQMGLPIFGFSQPQYAFMPPPMNQPMGMSNQMSFGIPQYQPKQ